MRLVDVERPFGGGKIIFYFTADGRVDFRALVRDLAKRYRTRIEMKQIGVRDEAKVLGDIADCGQELCCRTFLTPPATRQHAHGQGTEDHARSGEDFRPVRSAQVLPALRV